MKFKVNNASLNARAPPCCVTVSVTTRSSLSLAPGIYSRVRVKERERECVYVCLFVFLISPVSSGRRAVDVLIFPITARVLIRLSGNLGGAEFASTPRLRRVRA